MNQLLTFFWSAKTSPTFADVLWKNSLKSIHVFWHYMRFLPWNCPDGRYDNKTNTSILSIILASIKFTYCSKHFDGQLMWYKNEKICLPCEDFSVCLTISVNQIMGGLVLVCKCISFLDFFFLLWTAVCWYH